MKKLILLALTALLCSCVTVQVETSGPASSQNTVLGNYSAVKLTTCKATYSRFWSDVEGFEVTVCGGKMKLVKSTANDEFINSLVPLLKAAAVAP